MGCLLLAIAFILGLQVETAGRLLDAGNAQMEIRNYAEAERLYRQAIALYEIHEPGRQNHAIALDNLGIALENQKRFADAESVYQRAYDIRRLVLGPVHLDALTSLRNVGDAQLGQRKYAQAEATYRRAVAGLEESGQGNSEVAIKARGTLVNALLAQERYADAEAACRQLVAVVERQDPADDAKTGRALAALAGAVLLQHRNPEGEQIARRAVELMDRSGLPARERLGAHQLVAVALREQKRYAEAEREYLLVLALGASFLASDSRELGALVRDVGLIVHMQGRHDDADPYLQRALALFEKGLGDHGDTIVVLELIGDGFYNRRNYVEGERYRVRALEMRERMSGPASSEAEALRERLIDRMIDQGTEYADAGRFADAAELYGRGIARYEEHHGAEHLQIARLSFWLGFALGYLGQMDGAEHAMDRATLIRAGRLGEEHWETAAARTGLAWVRLRQRRFEEAEALARQAIVVFDAEADSPMEIQVFARAMLTRALVGLNQLAAARAEGERAVALARAHLHKAGEILAQALQARGMVAEAERDLPAARTFYGEALWIRERLFAAAHPDAAETRAALARVGVNDGREDKVRECARSFSAPPDTSITARARWSMR